MIFYNSYNVNIIKITFSMIYVNVEGIKNDSLDLLQKSNYRVQSVIVEEDTPLVVPVVLPAQVRMAVVAVSPSLMLKLSAVPQQVLSPQHYRVLADTEAKVMMVSEAVAVV